jgi:hypothetical protein
MGKKRNKNAKKRRPAIEIEPKWQTATESEETDPLTGYPASIRAIQPYQALKIYICPECNDVITQGSSHLVVVPKEAPDLRRHWHSYCWVRRQNRIPAQNKKSHK